MKESKWQGGDSFIAMVVAIAIIFASLIVASLTMFLLGISSACFAILFSRIRTQKIIDPVISLSSKSRKFIMIIVISIMINYLILRLLETGIPFNLLDSAVYIVVFLTAAIIILSIPKNSNHVDFLSILAIAYVFMIVVVIQFAIYPTPMGTDSWIHSGYVSETVANGYYFGGTGYEFFPITGILLASIEIIAGVGYQSSSLFGIAIPFSVIIACVLFIATKKIKISFEFRLIAILLLFSYGAFVNLALISIPNTLALGLVGLLFLLIFSRDSVNDPRKKLVILILFAALIFCHSLSSAYFLLVMITLVIASYAFKYKKPNTLSIPLILLFFAFMFGWWAYGSGTIGDLALIIKWGLSLDFLANPTPSDFVIVSSPFWQLIINAQLILILSLAVPTALRLRKNFPDKWLYYVSCIVPAAIFLGLPYLGIRLLSSRWLLILEISLLPLMAMAIFLIASISRKRPYAAPVLSVTLVVALLCLSPYISGLGNENSGNESIRDVLLVSELSAGHFINSTSKEKVQSDSLLAVALNSFQGNSKVDIFDQDVFANNLIKSNQINIIRIYIESSRFRIFGSSMILYYDLRQEIINSNNNIIFCTSTSYITLP